MKLSLVVMGTGKQEGKILPIPLAQFHIGRDPQCHLRPASPNISKRHCSLLQRDGKAFVIDYDSTNGTFVNDAPVKGEVELKDGDQLKVGPLAFVVKVEQSASVPVNRATPKPPTKAAAKPAAAATVAKASAAPAASSNGASDDDIAAMLMAIQDDGVSSPLGDMDSVPEGSTVMDMVVPRPGDGEKTEKDKETKTKAAMGNTSNAAKSILEQYMKRPRS
jgi:predicted component of type VI protein secretion system